MRTNVFLRDLDLGVGGVLDNRRLEVVVDGLPLFNGAQLAVDTTLVSPIRRDGAPRPKAHEVNGIALQHARRTRRPRTPNSQAEVGARLVVLAGEVGGRFSMKRHSFSAIWLGPRHRVSQTSCVGEPDLHGRAGGAPCSCVHPSWLITLTFFRTDNKHVPLVPNCRVLKKPCMVWFHVDIIVRCAQEVPRWFEDDFESCLPLAKTAR